MGRTSLSDEERAVGRDLPTKGNNGPSKQRFQSIFSEGKRVQGRFCRIYFLPGDGKIGWATAKAIGVTPRRNRTKRRFREALRDLTARIPDNLDLVVMIAPSGATAPLAEIRSDLEAILAEVTKRWAAESGSSS